MRAHAFAVLAVSLGLGLGPAAPAAAQDLLTQQRLNAFELGNLQAQQDLARQREIAAHNDLMALEARLRTEQGLSDVRAQSYTPRLPPVNAYQAYAGAPLPNIDTSKLVSIPDAALADSNRRVREAAANRR
jgi:hypothetical protein